MPLKLGVHMKLVCPPTDWANAIEITHEQQHIVEFIAKQLGLVCNCHEQTRKLYIGLPAGAEKPAESTDKAENPKHDDVLRFTMRLPKVATNTIIDGVIMLNGQMYKACSGCVGGQVYDRYWITGQSPIPPGRDYKVDLRWSYSDLIGIAGRYYHILPDPIERGDGSGLKRSEIGLHQDNGVPGTAGCIGVVNNDWSRLCNALDELAKFNRYLPLEVNYLCRD